MGRDDDPRLFRDPAFTLDQAMTKLETAYKEFDVATKAASAATSRKNAANKDVQKWSKIAVHIHRQPGLPLERYESELADDDEEPEEGTSRGGRKTTPAAAARGSSQRVQPPKRDETIETLIAQISDLDHPVLDPDDKTRCVCGHKLGTPGHPPAHASFGISMRNGDHEKIEHVKASLATLGRVSPTSPREPVGARKKTPGPRKKTPGGSGRPSPGARRKR